MNHSQSLLEEVRSDLVKAAEKRSFYFIDPEILRLSQELDKLIVANMRKWAKRS